MSSSRAKKVKMATKSCPECDQQVSGAGGAGCLREPDGFVPLQRVRGVRVEHRVPVAGCIVLRGFCAAAEPLVYELVLFGSRVMCYKYSGDLCNAACPSGGQRARCRV